MQPLAALLPHKPSFWALKRKEPAAHPYTQYLLAPTAALVLREAAADCGPGLQVTVKAIAIVPARSAVLRGPAERAVLDLMTARLAAVSLSGFIFFGSSVKISDQARNSSAVHQHHSLPVSVRWRAIAEAVLLFWSCV